MTQTAVQPSPSRARKRPSGIWLALALVVLVTVAVAIFGANGISRALAAERDARQAEAVAEMLPEAYDAAVCLASERDALAAGVPDVVMRPLAARTDLAIKEWDAKAASIDTGGDQELEAQVAEVQRSLDGLADLRPQMREPDTRAEAMLGYADLTSGLFGLTARVPSLSDEAAAAKAEALGSLQPTWEALGQERGLMLTLLTEKISADAMGTTPRSGAKEVAALAEAEASWRESIGDFYAKTSDRQRLALDELTDETAEDGAVGVLAQHEVREVVRGGVDKITMTPEAYVSSSGQLIEGLQRISVDAAEEVSDDATQDRQDASSVALLITVGVVCVVGLLLVIALVLLVLGVVLSRRRA
ncbi:MAG: nitrate- and nitrite sensing domain-containing protein [Nocardioides sp.]|uniref:nitrate- and nitrite sensing domain-containing protein n=1 Tax=Nocardioides sp. TaxID=35761 RepID=UPI003D6BAB42